MTKRGFTQLNPAKRDPALHKRAGYLTGFTLVEVIVSILVITVGVSAAYIATQKIISYTHQISSRLTAAYLAKEGIEIVRNIRDTNWLDAASPSWDYGLGAGDWEADYAAQDLGDTYDGDGNFLNINNDGFYSYGLGTSTKFKRRIRISDVGSANLTTTVSVWWIEKGDTYGPITAQEILYDWY